MEEEEIQKIYNKNDAVNLTSNINHSHQQCTHNIVGQSQTDHHDKDAFSQSIQIDLAPRLETANELYISTKIKSLDALLL